MTFSEALTTARRLGPCTWNSCGQPGRLYAYGHRCEPHSPANLAPPRTGREEYRRARLTMAELRQLSDAQYGRRIDTLQLPAGA